MKKVLLLSVPILAVLICAAVLMFPVAAGAAAKNEVRLVPGDEAPLASIPMDAKALELVSPDEPMVVQDTAARTFKMYLNIPSWYCVNDVVHIWINGKYKGYAYHSGLWYIGSYPRGSKYQIQCKDTDGSPYWKSKRVYVNVKSFTWIIYCP